MSVLPLRNLANIQQAVPPPLPHGEVVSTTPLGKDEHGKNLVAYVVRTEEEARIDPRVLHNANSNDPKLKKQTHAQDENKSSSRGTTSARFFKPESFLNNLEHAQLDQLRNRDSEIRNESAALHEGKNDQIISSFVYDKGPDGRSYAVGVAAPLLAQKAFNGEDTRKLPPIPAGALNPYVQAALAYRHSAAQDSIGPKAGLVDQSL